MRETPSTCLLLRSILILFTSLTTATEPPSGPTAVISIDSASPFQTMKPCARSCLVYEGIWACGVNGGYSDLGTGLSCGCSPQNFCYCDKNAAASASSYISECVSGGCGTEFPGEVTSVLSLYDGYCSTANVKVEAATTPVTVSTGSSSMATVGPTKNASTTGTLAAAETSSKSASSTSGGTKETQTADTSAEKKGLSSSDVIALGVGLGVGVPSLLLGLATFCVARRNKRQKAAVVPGHHPVYQPVNQPEIRYFR